LIASGVDFVLVGGFAAVAHGVTFGKGGILNSDALIRAKEAMNRDHNRITVKQLRKIKKRTEKV
jgi:hypothetical protein